MLPVVSTVCLIGLPLLPSASAEFEDVDFHVFLSHQHPGGMLHKATVMPSICQDICGCSRWILDSRACSCMLIRLVEAGTQLSDSAKAPLARTSTTRHGERRASAIFQGRTQRTAIEEQRSEYSTPSGRAANQGTACADSACTICWRMVFSIPVAWLRFTLEGPRGTFAGLPSTLEGVGGGWRRIGDMEWALS